MNQSVVVTGSGKGIGRAIARRLLADGWIVIGLERSKGSTSVEEGVCTEVIVADSAIRDSHIAAAKRATELAPLRGWVNNAGITRRTPLHNLEESLVREVMQINGLGYIWGSSVAVETFIAQRSGGSIVNIGSVQGRVSAPGNAAYEFTKGGIDALSRGIAVSYGRIGIRANTIAAGGIMTPHLENHIATDPDPVGKRRFLSEGPPMNRLGTVDEIASVAAFLLGSESSYLTGQSIAVDGAWTVALGKLAADPAVLAQYNIHD